MKRLFMCFLIFISLVPGIAFSASMDEGGVSEKISEGGTLEEGNSMEHLCGRIERVSQVMTSVGETCEADVLAIFQKTIDGFEKKKQLVVCVREKWTPKMIELVDSRDYAYKLLIGSSS